MREERRAVLSLIAAGRITAVEAERLVAAWTAEREVLWIAAAGAALLAAQAVLHGFGPGIAHLAHALSGTAHHAAAGILTGWGGWR